MLHTALFELYGGQGRVTGHSSQSLSVLCLDNSITLHPRKDDIEWFSEWGMAASRKENDYCHQLESMLRQYNDSSSVTSPNIAAWERDLRFAQIDSLIGNQIEGKDVVVIRLGENVSDNNRFEQALDSLVGYCADRSDKVVLTGCFWEDFQKELSIINVSRKRNVQYVPLFWIDKLYDARLSVEEQLFDTSGNAYIVTKEFIISHPNDFGHKMIAEKILKAL